jgi:hypothetical protein
MSESIPEPGESFDQTLLNIWSTGYCSGIITTLSIQLGVPVDLATRLATTDVHNQVRDPAYTSQLIEMLRAMWIQGQAYEGLGEIQVRSVHVNPDRH